MPSSHNLSVLYIDDEPSLLEVTKLFLELDERIKVQTEEDPLRGLELLGTGQYDVVVSDYQMPQMDGIALLKELRRKGNTIPFVLFTGKGREDVAVQALNSGADFYLQKGGEPRVQFGELRNVAIQLGERVRVQRALEASERSYRDLVESANSIILKIDLSGKILFVNGPGLAFYGFNAPEVIGTHVTDHFLNHAGLEPRLDEFIARLKADPTGFPSVVHRSVRKDGSDAWISWSVRGLADHTGHVKEALCIGTDITHRVETEKELESSYALIKTTLESIEEGVIVIDNTGHVLLYNDNIRTMLGLPPDLLDVRSKEPLVSFISTHARNWRQITHALQCIKENPLEKSFDILEFDDGRVLEVVSTPYMVGGALIGRVWSFRYAHGSKRGVDIPFRYQCPGS